MIPKIKEAINDPDTTYVLGLAEDGLIYRWITESGRWELHKD